MASVESKRMTAEEYGNLTKLPYPTELVRGEIVEISRSKPRHGEICCQAAFLLGAYPEAHPHGRVLTNDAGIITERDPDSVRGADIAYYSYDRVPRGPMPFDYLDVVPELVIEVRSPTDRWSEINVKVGEYLRAGVTMFAF